MRRRSLITAAALVWATPALSCTVTGDYRIPSGLELAAQADAIAIATVVGVMPKQQEWDSGLILRPTRLLKGAALPFRVELTGASLAGTPGINGRAVRSAPRELRGAHPDTGSGPCVRSLFAPGMQLVVFMKRNANGRFSVIRRPFSRDAEDVWGPNALWVKAVREYAAIAVHPRASWPARLRARAAELRRSRTPDDSALAADMAFEIGWLSLSRPS